MINCKEKMEKEQQIQNHKKKDNYGVCQWSNELKEDSKGSNCPEYLIMRLFMKGLFK